MLLKIVLIAMVLLAVIVVETNKLRRVVIYLGIFSFVSSFVYLLYGAPDVAIAEAVIGSTLATILYLVALKKYSVFTVYYLRDDTQDFDDSRITKARNELIYIIENFCFEKELEAQVIHTPDDQEHVIANHAYDMIIEQHQDDFRIIGNKDNYHLSELYQLIDKESSRKVIFVQEELP